ncbi:hypothetical protein BC832DRAFT_225705 [Gaertneriomyces semiglobifer]|nr:hypothetical protein BC832DRAFT_225705 [Gaertneriomyces semiglobifer]
MGRDRSETFISNSTFIRNSGHLSQTVFAAGGARVVIDNSSIIENAGTFLAQGRDTSLVIQNTVFEDAQFPAGSNGVVDAVFGGHLEITNSSMWTSAGTPADMLGTVWDTSVLTLNNVTITGYDCVMVFKIAGAGHLDAKGLFLSDITIKIAGLFFDRMPVDIGDDPRPSLIVGSSFTNMQGTLLSGGYTRLTVENSVFQGNVGPLLLFRDKNSVFEFSACLFSGKY